MGLLTLITSVIRQERIQGLTRFSEVALKAVCRLHARWTIRIARRPLDRPASLAAWGCNMLRPLQKAT